MTLAPKLLAPAALVATLAAGTWFLGAVVATTTVAAIGLGAAWFGVCCVLAWRAGSARPALRRWLNGTLAVCALAGAFAFWWTTIRETEFNEPIVTGVPASKVPQGELGPIDPLAPQE